VADDIETAPRFVTDTVTGMTLVEVPPGHFVMGSPASEAGRRDDETAHEVTISKPFLLGRFEVTQEQWRAVMGTSPGRFAGCGSTCPVEGVSHDEVRAFLDMLNRRANGVRFRQRRPSGSMPAVPVRPLHLDRTRRLRRLKPTTTAAGAIPQTRSLPRSPDAGGHVRRQHLGPCRHAGQRP
jgi:sulfatase-modifying factor enzyme 1